MLSHVRYHTGFPLCGTQQLMNEPFCVWYVCVCVFVCVIVCVHVSMCLCVCIHVYKCTCVLRVLAFVYTCQISINYALKAFVHQKKFIYIKT